ncbi:anhydro-N-acetylmuramic acid kinase [Pontibacter arcticus]|uniref:Anhydro-N-acetylmuramic acid kinase n=1 Tax=Pontibacter arcticus TaxID=2080288 RepID=A0A364RF51_9BACT|nr:anhydro-N-acetylmuramic acid kinase [Pontibacter arcticus]RAU82875.1 anhydro-N-acetylmuramic acid kinase [Pontibacter arcticus]
MNRNFSRLFQVIRKETKYIIGLMSGTSLDGLDVALCAFTGSGTNTKVEVKHFITKPYTPEFRAQVKAVFSKKQVDLEQVCILNAFIGNYHAELVLACLQEWGMEPQEIDAIASHGQTIYHAPASQHQLPGMPNATLQIGDGDHLAVNTGILTLSDFRQKHVAAGGEGAPLAGYGDFILFAEQGKDRVLLNIGGISNFTFLPGSLDVARMFSTDIGPGNTLMDAYVQQQFPGKFYDADAQIALSGKYNQALVEALLNQTFFQLDFPKTTGPELFNLDYLKSALQQSAQEQLAAEDVLSSLNRFTAISIANAIKQSIANGNAELFISGGGMHNPLLLQNLEELLPGVQIRTTAELGILPDAKEAVLFATLANETLAGEAATFENSNKQMPAVQMGKISFPF